MARLSASCPVLNEMTPDLEHIGGSLGSSPLHQPPSRKGSGKWQKNYLLIRIKELFACEGTQDWLCQPETQRRRSWTALEDLTGTKDKMKHNRQRR